MAKSLTPAHLRDVWPDEDWRNARLWGLDVPVQSMAVAELVWILDHPIWSTRPPEPRFDLRPLDVLADPEAHASHARRIAEADLALPLLVHAHQERLVVLDGLHRLARAQRDGVTSLPAKRVTREQLRASLRPA